ncbi:MAG: phosphoribosylamine--glycine ligase [Chloroflexota bacterium]
MNVLVIGSGAREHALAWKLRQSPRLTDLFIAPGNAGTAAVGTNLPIATTDFPAIAEAAQRHRVDLVVVGPEEPLARGIVDFLTERGIAVYGPSRAAAEIEASKAFAKELMARAGIPTAPARVFTDVGAALAYLDELETAGAEPPVIKADGLAAGKGVTVAASFEEARAAVRAALGEGVFGAAGRRVLVEQRLNGREVSAHAFSDGKTVVPMVYSCDYKRVYDGDQGPNTGGMGAYSPPGFLDAEQEAEIRRTIIEPAVRALAEMGRPYRGTLYPGLMITAAGPRVVEFNCRFGDPETQVLMPRLTSELLTICEACVRGRLADTLVTWSERAAVGVVLASGGYPGPYETGAPIAGLEAVDPDVQVFHAGTRRLDDGTVVTAGGRVLTVVATGATLAEARARAYDNVRRIRFAGCHARTDIALRELAAPAR